MTHTLSHASMSKGELNNWKLCAFHMRHEASWVFIAYPVPISFILQSADTISLKEEIKGTERGGNIRIYSIRVEKLLLF